MSNIAEGFESQTQGTFIDFLGHAKRSAGEVRSQLYIALDVNYLPEEQFPLCIAMVERCSKQIFRLIGYLKSIPNSYVSERMFRMSDQHRKPNLKPSTFNFKLQEPHRGS